jgi:hypothetical protein
VTPTPAPVLNLLVNNGALFTPGYSLASFPYTSSGAMSATVIGIPVPTTYKLADFQLSAVGGNFTIQNLSAVDANGFVIPVFSGLVNAQVITSGSTITFSLVSPLTKYRAANITYKFSILETGNTFSYNMMLTTN